MATTYDLYTMFGISTSLSLVDVRPSVHLTNNPNDLSLLGYNILKKFQMQIFQKKSTQKY